MKKVDETVRKETGYIAACTAILSMLTQAVFLVLGRWDLSVLLGNLFCGGVAVLNFFLLGLTVQSATQKEEKEAKETMRTSQRLRTVLLFVAAVAGVLAPCFHPVSALLSLFFPRIAILFRPLFMKKETSGEPEKE